MNSKTKRPTNKMLAVAGVQALTIAFYIACHFLKINIDTTLGAAVSGLVTFVTGYFTPPQGEKVEVSMSEKS